MVLLVSKEYVQVYTCQTLKVHIQVSLRWSSTRKHIITLFTLRLLSHGCRYNSSWPTAGGPPAGGAFPWKILDVDSFSVMPLYLAPMNQAAPIC